MVAEFRLITYSRYLYSTSEIKRYLLKVKFKKCDKEAAGVSGLIKIGEGRDTIDHGY